MGWGGVGWGWKRFQLKTLTRQLKQLKHFLSIFSDGHIHRHVPFSSGIYKYIAITFFYCLLIKDEKYSSRWLRALLNGNTTRTTFLIQNIPHVALAVRSFTSSSWHILALVSSLALAIYILD